MAVIPLIRQVVLGVTTFFSFIVLGISAYLLSQIRVIFCALGVAVAAVSLLTLPVMLVVDVLRRGAFTSMIVVELTWLSILWILWVATAGESAYAYSLDFPVPCDYVDVVLNERCQQTQAKYQAIEAFSFLNFIIVFLYTGFLFVTSVIAANRGQSIWLSSVKESFNSVAGPVQHPMDKYNASVPPHPQPGPQMHPTGTPRYAAVPTHSGSPAITV